MNKRWVGVLGGVAMLIGIVVIALSMWSVWSGSAASPTRGEGEPGGPGEGAVDRNPIASAAPRTPSSVNADASTTDIDEFGPNSAAAGHQDVAAALGYTMIRCFVGHDFPSDELVGRYVSSVEDGWFSTVVTEPSGETILERRTRSDDSKARDWEPVAVVRWASDDPEATLVECSIDPVVFGSVEVRVNVEGGGPIDDLSIYACGAKALPIDGIARLDDVLGPGPCTVRGFGSRYPEVCKGHVVLPKVAADQRTSVELTIECVDAADYIEEHEEDRPLALAKGEERSARIALEYEALLAYSEAHPRTGRAAQVIDELLERWTPRPPMTLEETLRAASDLLGEKGMSEEDIQSALDLLEDAAEPVED